MTGTDHSPKPTLESFHPARIANQIRRTLHVDLSVAEDLADEIWLECFEHGWLPTKRHIRNKIVDFLRSRSVELNAQEHYLRSRPNHPSEDDIQFVHELINQTNLSQLETQVLYLRFWWGLDYTQIAGSIGVSYTKLPAIYNQAIEKLYLTARRK